MKNFFEFLFLKETVMKKVLGLLFFVMITLNTSLDARRPLFDAYPALKGSLAWEEFGTFPTPVTPAYTLAQTLGRGVNLFVKQDGLSGHVDRPGHQMFGGNKVRKLEVTLAHAKSLGRRHIYAMGGAGSNYAVAAAAYSRLLGLDCTLVLGPQRNTGYAQRNLMLDLYYGADIRACIKREDRNPMCKGLAGADPEGYFTPLGGSSPIGAIGFVNAVFELREQIGQGLLPVPDFLYVAISSSATAAGLMIGVAAISALGPKCIIRAVRIDDTPEEREEDLRSLIPATSKYLHDVDSSFPIMDIRKIFTHPISHTEGFEVIDGAGHVLSHFEIINDVAGDDMYEHIKGHEDRTCYVDPYALITPQDHEAIKLLNVCEGIKLEGTYTGKAFSALMRDARAGLLSGKNVLFWDTFCSGPFSEEISTVDVHRLPPELQNYVLTTYPLQIADQGI